MESADEVVARAADHGFDVSDAQRRRYHAAEVLPRPRMVGLGRGRGRKAFYPPGTGEQLVRLQQLLREDRSLDRARYRLWWEGYAVPENSIKDDIDRALDELEPLVRLYEESDPGSDNDPFWDRLDRYATKRLPTGLLAQARRRLPRGALESVICICLDALLGREHEDGESMSRDVAAAVGLPRRLTAWVDEARAVTAEHVALRRQRTVLTKTSGPELRSAREELRTIGWLMSLIARLGNSEPDVQRAADRAVDFTGRGTLSQPVFLSLWLSVRIHPSLEAGRALLTQLHRRGSIAQPTTDA